MRYAERSNFSDRVAAEVRAEMARQQKSAANLGQLLDLKPAATYRRMKGTTDFTIDELDVVCEWLGVGLLDLITRARSVA